MAIYQGNGTWGPQSGIAGYLNPFSRDLSATENALTVASRGAPQKASVFYNPKAIANSNPQPQVYNIGGTKTSISPVNYDQINKQNAPINNGSYGPSMSTASASSLDSTIIPPNTSSGDGVPSEMDTINSEFNAFNSYLDQQAGAANQNFTDTKALYDTSKTNAEKQYTTEKAAQTEGYKKDESLNLAKVRQLLSDLTQSNASRMAITGGGSVSEALGERFGRMAQEKLGNVMDTTQRAIQRTNDFYNNALTKLQETYDSSILQARQTLNDNLSNIQNARMQSAAAKQQNTISAWKEYYNNVNQAKIQAAQFKANYDLWKQQQDSQLASTQGFQLSNNQWYQQNLQPSFEMDNPSATVQNSTETTAFNPYFNQFTNLTDEQKKLYGLA